MLGYNGVWLSESLGRGATTLGDGSGVSVSRKLPRSRCRVLCCGWSVWSFSPERVSHCDVAGVH